MSNDATSPRLEGGFVTPWEYDRTVEHRGATYNLWTCGHREGYTAWQITHQPAAGSGVDFVRPKGTGHYTSLESLCEKTGIVIEGRPLPQPSEADLRVLREIRAKTEGKSWEPPDPRHPFVLRMIAAGLIERRDGRFMFERFKDSHLAFTDAGRSLIPGTEPVTAPAP